MRALALFSLLLLASLAAANELVTNETVAQMVQIGLNEDIILAKIEAGPSRFDTSTGALSTLQQAKVPNKIIAAKPGFHTMALLPNLSCSSSSTGSPPAPRSHRSSCNSGPRSTR